MVEPWPCVCWTECASIGQASLSLCACAEREARAGDPFVIGVTVSDSVFGRGRMHIRADRLPLNPFLRPHIHKIEPAVMGDDDGRVYTCWRASGRTGRVSSGVSLKSPPKRPNKRWSGIVKSRPEIGSSICTIGFLLTVRHHTVHCLCILSCIQRGCRTTKNRIELNVAHGVGGDGIETDTQEFSRQRGRRE